MYESTKYELWDCTVLNKTLGFENFHSKRVCQSTSKEITVSFFLSLGRMTIHQHTLYVIDALKALCTF